MTSEFPDRPRSYVSCSHEGCEMKIKDHYWGKVKATGWFFQKDGSAWCPSHIPEWVESWRAKKNKSGS